MATVPEQQPTDEQIAAAAKTLGIPELCIRVRLELGWRPHDALTKPPRRRQGYVRRSWQWLERWGRSAKANAKAKQGRE